MVSRAEVEHANVQSIEDVYGLKLCIGRPDGSLQRAREVVKIEHCRWF